MKLSRVAFCSVLTIGLGILPGLGWGGEQKEDKPKVVIPFDFQSKFDDGRYGKIVGNMVWKKLDRQGKFVIPEAMLDVRDTLEANKAKLSADTPMETVKRLLEDQFGGQIAIWGSVERVKGHDFDVYDLKVRCVDFSAKPKPRVIYTVDARTKTVSEIPHTYLKAMFDALYEKAKKGTGTIRAAHPSGPAGEWSQSPFSPEQQKIIAANWAKNPNLVAGGDFQKGAGGVPSGWDKRGGQLREPVGNLVRWEREGENRFMRLSFDKKLGDSFGVMYYSDRFHITEGATYRFRCRWRTDGPKAKIFIKCYTATSSGYHEEGKPSAPSGSGAERLREVYRNQQNLEGEKGQWNVRTEDFTPRHTKYTPRWGRVMLYGYLGAGKVDFDDVVIKEILPASAHDRQKDPRHSLESGVTIREQEENRQKNTKNHEAHEDNK